MKINQSIRPHQARSNRALTNIFLAATSVSAATIVGTSESASAVQITLNSQNYDVTTVTGTFADLQSTLESTPWWNDFNLAKSATNQVGVLLGLPNTGNTGLVSPMFQVNISSSSGAVQGYIYDPTKTPPATLFMQDANSPYTYAVLATSNAAAVPEPSGISGTLIAGLGMGTLIVIRKRKAKLTQTVKNYTDVCN